MGEMWKNKITFPARKNGPESISLIQGDAITLMRYLQTKWPEIGYLFQCDYLITTGRPADFARNAWRNRNTRYMQSEFDNFLPLLIKQFNLPRERFPQPGFPRIPFPGRDEMKPCLNISGFSGDTPPPPFWEMKPWLHLFRKNSAP